MTRYDRTALCVHLRSKNMYTDVDSEPGRPRDTSTEMTEVFWCVRTMNLCGPDDCLAGSEACRRGRACFEGLLD